MRLMRGILIGHQAHGRRLGSNGNCEADDQSSFSATEFRPQSSIPPSLESKSGSYPPRLTVHRRDTVWLLINAGPCGSLGSTAS
jgi:hypothetical protein